MIYGLIGLAALIGFGVFVNWPGAICLFVLLWMNNLREL